VTGKQLTTLENAYLMALCVMDHYALQGVAEQLSVAQFASTQGLDWNEMDELSEHLRRKDIAA
jgi:hypothetical protein